MRAVQATSAPANFKLTHYRQLLRDPPHTLPRLSPAVTSALHSSTAAAPGTLRRPIVCATPRSLTSMGPQTRNRTSAAFPFSTPLLRHHQSVTPVAPIRLLTDGLTPFNHWLHTHAAKDQLVALLSPT